MGLVAMTVITVGFAFAHHHTTRTPAASGLCTDEAAFSRTLQLVTSAQPSATMSAQLAGEAAGLRRDASTFAAQGDTQIAHDVGRLADDLDAWRTADPSDPVAGGFAIERATSDLENLPPC
jgi:hypothetical protein